jgi:hypothetical protein
MAPFVQCLVKFTVVSLLVILECRAQVHEGQITGVAPGQGQGHAHPDSAESLLAMLTEAKESRRDLEADARRLQNDINHFHSSVGSTGK